MTSRDLESVALKLVSEGKGILAADETTPTLTLSGSNQPSKADALIGKCFLPHLTPPSSSANDSPKESRGRAPHLGTAGRPRDAARARGRRHRMVAPLLMGRPISLHLT